MNKEEMFFYHPTRFEKYRKGYLKELIENFAFKGYNAEEKVNKISKWLFSQYIKKHNPASFPTKDDLEKYMTLSNSEALTIWEYIEFYEHGRNIFNIDSDLVNLFKHTDVSNLKLSDFIFPYESFYISFGVQNDILGFNIYPVDGFYFRKEEESLYLNFTFIIENGGNNLIDAPQVVELELNNNITIKESIDLYFKKHREKSGRGDLDISEIENIINFGGKLVEVINLSVNCLAYLNFKDKVMETRFPNSLPKKLANSLKNAKSSKEISQIEEKIVDLGYSKINYCNNIYNYNNISETSEKQYNPKTAHWRKGHWRKQPYGAGKVENKLIWILPVLVNKSVGTVVKGHIYKVKGEK